MSNRLPRAYNSIVPIDVSPAKGTPILIRYGASTIALCLGLAIGAAVAGPVSAGSLLALDRATPEEILLAQRALEDSTASVPVVEPPAPPAGAIGSLEDAAAPRAARKPGIGVLLSLIVPGAGHLYAGEARGWANIGLDVASWASYLRYHDLGKAKEDEFRAYADKNWDYARWVQNGQIAGCAECSPGTPEDSLILAFRDGNRQHYYEDIGKLPTYFYGWDDWTQANSGDPTDRGDSAHRQFYAGMRNHSNNYLKNARYSFTAAMVNRVVSAVDVFRMLKRRAMPQLGQNTQIRFRLRTRPFSEETRVGFVVTKRI